MMELMPPFYFLISVACLLMFCGAHPQCLDSYPPYTTDLDFCTSYSGFGCCTVQRDRELQAIAANISGFITEFDRQHCTAFIQDILCQECSPYAAHLFNAEGRPSTEWTLFPGLCINYCWEFYHSCNHLVPYLTKDNNLLQAAKSSPQDFCEAIKLDDADYCYPNVLSEDDLNSAVRMGEEGSGEGCLCLEEFANNLRNPLALVYANDSTHRMYVAEQLGFVYVYFPNGTYVNKPFLNISNLVYVTSRRGDERGFLGIAFHPNYNENHKFFVYYTSFYDNILHIIVSELVRDDVDPNTADPRSERRLLELETPAANHNGGSLFFGYDGFLYISIGDGGKAGDPFGEYGNALNKYTLLGKILRIDVNGRDANLPYAIPDTNPFVNENPQEVRHEIYVYGVRNMWRCSIDRGDPQTGYGKGRIICGDVGQNKYEEIDIIYSGGNYGWRAKEGHNCYDPDLCNERFLENEVEPIHVYPHSVGKSVTGGYIYRGCENPHLNGQYIYGDFTNGRLFKLEEDTSTGEWINREICMGASDICTGHLQNSFPKNILSFGESESGELYILVTDLASSTNPKGQIFKFVDPARRGNPNECDLNVTPVDVFGPVTAFQPSNNGQGKWFPHGKENGKVKRDAGPKCARICQDTSLTPKAFCAASYAITAKIMKMTLFNNQIRYRISNITVHRKDSYIPEFYSQDEIVMNKKIVDCNCFNIEKGEKYLIFGSYNWETSEYQIKKSSYVRISYWFDDYLLEDWKRNSRKC